MVARALSSETFAVRLRQAVIKSAGLLVMELLSRRPQAAGASRFFPGE
jgi:hypothetical protein